MAWLRELSLGMAALAGSVATNPTMPSMGSTDRPYLAQVRAQPTYGVYWRQGAGDWVFYATYRNYRDAVPAARNLCDYYGVHTCVVTE